MVSLSAPPLKFFLHINRPLPSRLCGFVTVKVGKAVAVAVGGSIILLQIANDQGYIKVNWDKLASKTDKLMDKVEERITGEGPTLLDKVRHVLFVYVICFACASVCWFPSIRLSTNHDFC